MSNNSNKGNSDNSGRALFEGTVKSLTGHESVIDNEAPKGHSGELVDQKGQIHNFITQGGLLVKVGEPVMAYSEVENHGQSSDNPGDLHKNTDHGGPKAIVVEAGNAAPPRN